MFKLRPIVAFIVGAGLLQACSAPPTRQELAMQAVMRVRHSSDQTAATYYQLGKYHQEHGDLELAVTAYTHSIALDGRQLEPRNALGAALAGQGRLDEAKSVLQQLVTDYPAIAHPYNNLGYVYFMQGNYSAAVTTLQHALAIDAGYERARNNLDAAQAAVASHAEPGAAAPLVAAPEKSSGTPEAAEARAPAVKEEDAPAAVTADLAPGQPAMETLVPAASASAAPAPATPEPQAIVSVDPALVPQSHVDSALAPQSHADPALVPQSYADPALVPQSHVELAQIVFDVAEPQPQPVGEPVPVELPLGPLPVATAPPAAPAAAAKSSRVEIANGNGVTGMAKRARHMLGLSGIAVSRLTNERPYTQQITKIQYRLGFQRQAKALQEALRGHAAMMLVNNLSPGSDVRLVLGKDAVAHMASIDGVARGPLLAMNQATN